MTNLNLLFFEIVFSLFIYNFWCYGTNIWKSWCCSWITMSYIIIILVIQDMICIKLILFIIILSKQTFADRVNTRLRKVLNENLNIPTKKWVYSAHEFKTHKYISCLIAKICVNCRIFLNSTNLIVKLFRNYSQKQSFLLSLSQ